MKKNKSIAVEQADCSKILFAIHVLKSSNHKRHNEMAIDETINSYKNHIERHFADFTNQQKISILEKLLEIFGKDSVEINMNYFKDKY